MKPPSSWKIVQIKTRKRNIYTVQYSFIYIFTPEHSHGSPENRHLEKEIIFGFPC